jgi:hypothetical protein
MQIAALLLASALVAGDPVAEFDVEGVRLGMTYSDVEGLLPELTLVRAAVELEEGWTLWTTEPGAIPQFECLTLAFDGDTLRCVTVDYSRRHVEKHGLKLFCSAIRDRFGRADITHETDKGPCFIWISQQGEYTAMLGKDDDKQSARLIVGEAQTLLRRMEQMRRTARSIDLGLEIVALPSRRATTVSFSNWPVRAEFFKQGGCRCLDAQFSWQFSELSYLPEVRRQAPTYPSGATIAPMERTSRRTADPIRMESSPTIGARTVT